MGRKGVWASPNIFLENIKQAKAKDGLERYGTTFVLLALKTHGFFISQFRIWIIWLAFFSKRKKKISFKSSLEIVWFQVHHLLESF
jgi:hypothetical protein